MTIFKVILSIFLGCSITVQALEHILTQHTVVEPEVRMQEYSFLHTLELRDKQSNAVIGHIKVLPDYCFITELQVEDQFRNQGYGSLLLKLIKEKALQNNCSNLELSAQPLEHLKSPRQEYCAEQAKLVQFYKKNGFNVLEDSQRTDGSCDMIARMIFQLKKQTN